MKQISSFNEHFKNFISHINLLISPKLINLVNKPLRIQSKIESAYLEVYYS